MPPESEAETIGNHNSRGRLRLPEWLRPPVKRDHAASSLQFLPLYYVGAVLIFLVLGTAIEWILPASTSRLMGSLLSKIVLAVAIIVPAFALSRVAGRSFGDYGLPRERAFGKLFWLGVLWGFVFLSVLLLALRAAGVVSFASATLSRGHALKFAIFWAVFFLFVALFEEFAFRGYVQFAIAQLAGFWPTALFLSAMFAYVHHSNPGESVMGTLGAGAVAIVFCVTAFVFGSM